MEWILIVESKSEKTCYEMKVLLSDPKQPLFLFLLELVGVEGVVVAFLG